MTNALATGPLARIQTKDGRVYQLTADDLLWLGRAVQFEGGDAPAATLWTYAQRWALLRWRGSLASLVRAHSQPLNPRWASLNADKCRQYPELCGPAQLARRRAARTIRFSQLQRPVQGLVRKWGRAEIANPVPRAVDFAARPVARSCLEAGRCSRVVLDARNVYLTTDKSDGWDADFVTLVGAEGRIAGPASSASSLIWWAVGVAALGAGWWAWRRYASAS